MTDRNAAIEVFLQVNGQGHALRKKLAGDASARRYERLIGGDCPAILMDAPPDQPTLRTGSFLRIAEWLLQHGLSAPRIIAHDIEAGLVLLEDLGDGLFSAMLSPKGESREAELYGAAVDVLVELQRLTPPPDLPPYDDEKMLEEASRFTRWYAPALSERAKADYLDIWRDLLSAMRVGPATFVYVDYHADNLIWLPEREGLARVGLLDFQDGRLGPPAYDLVSLLEDARRDVEPALAETMVERYLLARPDLDPDAFRVAYAVLGAHRNSKILGMIANWSRTGKPHYLALHDRVRDHLKRDLAHPRLATLAAWFDNHIALKIAS
jgi:aminoglycoside/choline kinase family phosphotransferase